MQKYNPTNTHKYKIMNEIVITWELQSVANAGNTSSKIGEEKFVSRVTHLMCHCV